MLGLMLGQLPSKLRRIGVIARDCLWQPLARNRCCHDSAELWLALRARASIFDLCADGV